MYSADNSKKQINFETKNNFGYLARPKLGWLKNIYFKYPGSMRPLSYYGLDKKKKSRKATYPKMDYRKKPDYADTAYREAVSRLRVLLAESYTPYKRMMKELDSAGEETDNQSVLSGFSRASRFGHTYYHSKPILQRKYPYYFTPYRSTSTTFNVGTTTDHDKTHSDSQKWDGNAPPPELMSFIERQEEYIEQLEKESRFCREELSTLLSKVKDVITENENLHEKQKNHLIKSVFDHLETETETETDLDTSKKITKRSKSPRRQQTLEGPTIVFESRISELEAQLTQTKIDLKKAQDENESFKKKIADGSITEGLGYDTFKRQIEALQREKNVLQETVSKLQSALNQLRDKESDCSDKVKRSLDVAEQAQYEKSAAEHEIRRLKDELERQHAKLREAISEQGRKVADERNSVERRYTQQVEQLTNELGVQWETTSKLQLELDKQRREDSDLRRELAQKQALIEELRKEMHNKILTYQADIGVSSAEKSALEQQIASLQLANERCERQAKQESGRLLAEMQSLRQRLDRADADLIHSRRENLRLTEQVAALEKEINLHAALSDERSKRSGNDIIALPPPKEDREKELTTMIKDMESKHEATVAELEGMIHTQNQLMEKLSTECHALTQKLEDANNKHKEEIRELQTNLGYLTSSLGQSQIRPPDIKDKNTKPNFEKIPPTQPHPTATVRRQSGASDSNAPIAPKVTQRTESNLTRAPLQNAEEKLLQRSNSKTELLKQQIEFKNQQLRDKETKDQNKPSNQGRFEQKQYNKNQLGLNQTNQKFDQSKFNQNQFDQSQYEPEQYDQSQYDQRQYDRNQFDQSQFDQSQFDQSQYDQSHYDQNQYSQSQYDQSQYDQSQYNQIQYDQSQFDQSQYDPSQYDQNQYQQYGEYDAYGQDPNQQYDSTQQYDSNQPYVQYDYDEQKNQQPNKKKEDKVETKETKESENVLTPREKVNGNKPKN